eukprot:1157729-Pelagomonas_calceolata.AAC.8
MAVILASLRAKRQVPRKFNCAMLPAPGNERLLCKVLRIEQKLLAVTKGKELRFYIAGLAVGFGWPCTAGWTLAVHRYNIASCPSKNSAVPLELLLPC